MSDSTRPLVAVIHDNFGGSRRFASQAWNGQQLVFTRDSAGAGGEAERFTFRERDGSDFWFAWEVKRQGSWVLGDSLACARM